MTGSESAGRTALKITAIIFAAIGMVGFGACGLFGIGLGASAAAPPIVLLGLGGLAIAAVLLFVIVRLVRGRRR